MSDQWKLVPVEPTEEMLAAARPAYSSNIQASNTANRDKYQRMLAVAPTQGADGESLRPVAIYQISPALHSGMWIDTDAEHYADYLDGYRRIVYATRDAAPSEDMKPAGIASAMPGVAEWTVTVCKAEDVPIGTQLYVR